MKIDKAEIERIIDDFETKARQSNEVRKVTVGGNTSFVHYTSRRDALEYAAAVLRQVLHD